MLLAVDTAEMVEVKKGREILRKENELLVLKNEELRELLRRLREQLVAREKEAEKLRRRARLMQEDRVVLQDEVVSDREHVRKLEARIATMKDAAGLEARVLRYRQQAEDASRKCRQLADKLAVAEEDMGDKCREVKVLQAALRLHAAQMAPSESGQDGVSTYSTLLYNLASAQEEAARLSILMGEHQEQLLLDQEMMSQARRDLARVTKSRDEAAAQNMALHKRLTEARAAIVAVERENVQMKSAVAATRAALEAAHGKIQSLQSQMISAAESSQERREQQAAAVQEALALQQAAHVQQLQAFEAQVSEARADWAAYEEAKERELEELRDALRQQAESMAAASREALEAQARKAGQQLAEAQAAAAAERAVMQQQAQAAAAKAEAQLGAAAAEVQSVRLSLRQQIEAQQAAAKAQQASLQAQLEGQAGQVRTLQAELEELRAAARAAQGAKSAEAEALAEQVHTLCADLATLGEKNAELSRQLTAQAEVVVAARAAQQALEGQLASAQEANRALSASKGMLQSTMLEQLDLVKTKLVASERANARLKQQVLEHQLAATQQQAELLSGALRSAAAAGGGTMGPSPAPSPNPKPQVPIAEALDREILIRLSPLRAAMRASAAGGATAGADVSSSRSSTSSALLAALAASGLAGPGAAEGGGATPAGSLPPFPAATKAAASQKPLSPHDRHADGANKTTGSTAAAKFFFG